MQGCQTTFARLLWPLTELVVVDAVALQHGVALQPGHGVEEGDEHHAAQDHQPHQAQQVGQQHELHSMVRDTQISNNMIPPLMRSCNKLNIFDINKYIALWFLLSFINVLKEKYLFAKTGSGTIETFSLGDPLSQYLVMHSRQSILHRGPKIYYDVPIEIKS